jgi:hypothetical protein
MIYDNIIRITMFKVSAEQKKGQILEIMISFYRLTFPNQSLEYQSLNQTLLSYPFLHNTSKKMLFLFLLRVSFTKGLRD